jgi:hypothetical protein
MMGGMKSYRAQVFFALAVILSAMLAGSVVESREVRCTILQQKLGRLYFSVGKEDDVWPGCRWVLYRDSTDTSNPIAQGKIAESYEGVSVSHTLQNFSIDSLPALFPLVMAADSFLGTIGFGCAIDFIQKSFVGDSVAGIIVNDGIPYSTEEIGSDFQRQTGVRFAHRVVLPDTEPIDRLIEVMPASFALDISRSSVGSYPDVYVSYSLLNCGSTEFHISSPAPFFVALIPNVSRPVNRNALLTTALRYKIDTSRLSSVFEFGSVPQQSFLPDNLEYSAYTSDAAKGKKLLKESKSGGTSVTIDCHSPTLGSTCRFIRGTLVQAGYTTSSVGWNEPADLRLMIVPIYSDSPWVALREVLASLSADTVERDKSNQPIRLADRLLTDAMQTSDSTQRLRLLQRVDRILQEDVGAFPLFRPIIHVCAKVEIRGIKFDKDGRLDLRSIYRLKLPSDSQESAP